MLFLIYIFKLLFIIYIFKLLFLLPYHTKKMLHDKCTVTVCRLNVLFTVSRIYLSIYCFQDLSPIYCFHAKCTIDCFQLNVLFIVSRLCTIYCFQFNVLFIVSRLCTIYCINVLFTVYRNGTLVLEKTAPAVSLIEQSLYLCIRRLISSILKHKKILNTIFWFISGLSIRDRRCI